MRKAFGTVAAMMGSLAVMGGGTLALQDCYRATGLLGKEYVLVTDCVGRGEKLKPPGMQVVESEPVLFTLKKKYRAGDADGFECACAAGPACERLHHDKGDEAWVPAERGNTFAKGQWRGADCFRKNCVENAGDTIWPRECPGG